MSISLRSNPDGSGTLLNGSTPVMEITAAGVVSLPNISAGSSATQPANLGQFIGTNVSLSGNGYQKLPSGLIIQWGVVSTTPTGTWVFPIAFPTVCASVTANTWWSGSTTPVSLNSPPTTTSVVLRNGAGALQVYAIAIGY